MNAKTYLDVTQTLSRVSSCDALRKSVNRFGDLNKFYSQPFKPSLITELFTLTETTKKVKGMDLEIVFMAKGVGETYFDIKQKKWFYHGINCDFYAPAPITINDFISDCLRAGIELAWSSDVIKEYFPHHYNP